MVARVSLVLENAHVSLVLESPRFFDATTGGAAVLETALQLLMHRQWTSPPHTLPHLTHVNAFSGVRRR